MANSGTEWLRQQRAQAAGAIPMAPVCNNTEAIDSQVERFLQENGVKYAPKTQVPISMIDEKASLNNQARDVPLIPENVDRYAAHLKKGEYLPPVIVFPDGNKLRIIDGNNRYAAHKKAGSQFVPGYVIDESTDSATIQMLTVAANTHHGETPTLKWRVRQASLLVSHGFTAEIAAEKAGVTKGQLGDYQAAQRADARARQLKVNAFAELPQTVRRDLGRIQLDTVFLQACRCAIDTGMQTEDARLLLKEVKARGSESEQIEYVTALAAQRRLEEKARKAAGGKTTLSSPKTSLSTAIGKIMHVDPAELARTILTEDDLNLVLKRIDECVEWLGSLEAALAAGREARRAG